MNHVKALYIFTPLEQVHAVCRAGTCWSIYMLYMGEVQAVQLQASGCGGGGGELQQGQANFNHRLISP